MSLTRPRLALFAAMTLAGLAAAQADADLNVLRARGIDPAGPALLNFLKKRTPTADVAKKIDTLIKGLDDDEQDVREKSMQGLAEMGPLARGKLAEAVKTGDAEVKRRARWALEKIGPAADDATILPAAVRVLAARKPAGALEVLLAFLPHIDNADALEEASVSLGPLGADKDGKPDPLMLKALASPSASVRGAAGQALAKVAAARDAVRKLLADAQPGVRRRVAMALLEARDKEAIPALVALTGSDSDDDAGVADDALTGLAGEKAPEPVSSGDARAREKTKANWERWWKDAGPTFDLAKADLHSGGRGMAILGVQEVGVGKVGTAKIIGFDAGGNKKFTIDSVRSPTHASMSRRDRVICCEVNYNRVIEVDLKGKIHATISVTQPLHAYRLRNGNLFVAARSGLFVYDKTNRQIHSFPQAVQVTSAYMFDDGTMSVLMTNRQLVRLGKDGKEKGSVRLGTGISFSLYGLKPHFLPDGGVVVPEYSQSMVRAYDKDGKLRWETSVPRPSSVTQLPGGNYMITQRLSNQMTELDKDGKVVRTKTVSEGRPLFYDRR